MLGWKLQCEVPSRAIVSRAHQKVQLSLFFTLQQYEQYLTYLNRLSNGTCAWAAESTCTPTSPCPNGMTQCYDGTCSASCPASNGCPLLRPIMVLSLCFSISLIFFFLGSIFFISPLSLSFSLTNLSLVS